MTAVSSAPSTVDVLDVREAATEYVDTVSGYQGESPWEYARGVAAALAWAAGEGPRPDVHPRCDACKGAGQHGHGLDEECRVCWGSGVAP